jgi:hypothetical protein
MNLLINKYEIIAIIKMHFIFHYLPDTGVEREQMTAHFMTQERIIFSIDVRGFSQWNRQ